MPIRQRKLIGTVLLLVLVTVWTFTAMVLAQTLLSSVNGLLAAVYYIIAGMGWALPAMPLVRWMSRPNTVTPR